MSEGKTMVKLVKLLANLGYGSRREVTRMLDNGWVSGWAGQVFDSDDSIDLADRAAYAALRIDDEPADPAPGMVLMLHKPVGYTCSTKDPGRLVYDLLPERFRCRKPALSTIGRLDRETSGLLLLTDDGALLHRVIAPKSRVGKVYRATLAENLRGDEAAVFAAGTLLLEGETEPLAPATLEVLGQREVLVTLYEGRYHQVRRMFAAMGNHVATLERLAVGGLRLAGLPVGQWQLLDTAEIGRIFCASSAALAVSAVPTADTGG